MLVVDVAQTVVLLMHSWANHAVRLPDDKCDNHCLMAVTCFESCVQRPLVHGKQRSPLQPAAAWHRAVLHKHNRRCVQL